MQIIEDIAKIMQSKGYCEKSSYQWTCYVLSSMIDVSNFEKVKQIAEAQETYSNNQQENK